MIDASVVRYSSQGKFTTLEAALKKLVKIRERHPDREYTIIINTRASKSYNVAQVKIMRVQVPEKNKDYRDPGPPRPPKGSMWGSTADRAAWAAYDAERADYEAYIERQTGGVFTMLKEPMNP